MQLAAFLIAGLIGFFALVWGWFIFLGFLKNKILDGEDHYDYDDY